MGYQEIRDFLNGKGNNTSSFIIDRPLKTPEGLGKEIKGNIEGTNILGRLENEYRGKMIDRQIFKDSRIETNIVGVTSVSKFLAENNIQPVGGTDCDDVTNTQEFLKDVDTHIIKEEQVQEQTVQTWR